MTRALRALGALRALNYFPLGAPSALSAPSAPPHGLDPNRRRIRESSSFVLSSSSFSV